jgi:hypothetical protein
MRNTEEKKIRDELEINFKKENSIILDKEKL